MMTSVTGLFRAILSSWILCSVIITFLSLLLMGNNMVHDDSSPPSLSPMLKERCFDAHRPPFKRLVQGRKIVGDVQFLLDFAIVAFAKCSTSATSKWLSSHPEAQVLPGETKDLRNHQPDKLTARLYHQLPEGSRYKRGYKNPGDLKFFHAIQTLAEYWPSTKLLIALRHPVLRFESFYNFRLDKQYSMPPANKLIGPCRPINKGVCTDSAALHTMLAKLGKTNMTTQDELELLQNGYHEMIQTIIPNKIFLYTVDRFGDSNQTRSQVFARDVQHFLGFSQEMPPIPSKPSKANYTTNKLSHQRINICDCQYQELRRIHTHESF
jgi:hypothetical protein